MCVTSGRQRVDTLSFYQPAAAQSAQPAGPKITLPFLRLYIYIYI